MEWRKAVGRERERERDDVMNVSSSSSFSASPGKALLLVEEDDAGMEIKIDGPESVNADKGHNHDKLIERIDRGTDATVDPHRPLES